MKLLALIFCAVAALASSPARAELKTVPKVDVNRYLGSWYEIAVKPVIFETGCVCTRQKLDLNADGKVGVYNSCNNFNSRGGLREIRGTATPADDSNSKFDVDFGLPWKGKYWIIALDPDYRWAVVSDPDNVSLYVLSKTPELSKDLYDKAVQEAAEQVDVSVLKKTEQRGCKYP